MTAEEKARKYLAEGRLTVTRVLPAGPRPGWEAPITAECRGSDTVYRLGFDATRGEWRCTCQASAEFRRRCSHLIALQLVTKRPT